jgi:meiotically up-regulated gene 157 (Mug157) protein
MHVTGLQIPLAITKSLQILESKVSEARYKLAEGAIERLFSSTLTRAADGSIFVITGDIPAMWLRDSTWQVRPLLAAANDLEVAQLIADVSKRQIEYVLTDPYANAFNPTPDGNCWHKDFPDQSPWVFERKFELDSLAAVLDLAIRLYLESGFTNQFTERFNDAIKVILDLLEREQNHDPNTYRFERKDVRDFDFLSHGGYGSPVAYTGMIWSGFRPSDDACKFGYLIPANAHMAKVLEQLAELPDEVFSNQASKDRALKISGEIKIGIEKFGLVEFEGKQIFAYECDGLGNYLLQDDANIPSLLSLPYLGVCSELDPIYLNTREFILSSSNPYFYSGQVLTGLGSQHTPENQVWPLGIAMQGITSTSEREIEECLKLLELSHAGTNQMHESVEMDDPRIFTREWFSWADMTFYHLLLKSVNLI